MNGAAVVVVVGAAVVVVVAPVQEGQSTNPLAMIVKPMKNGPACFVVRVAQ